jgi:hypothetical protein
MQISREQITPAIAKRYLAKNKRNRTFRPRWAKRLARMMVSGDWHETHQGIAFNCDGSLRDGQHRLAAVIESGTTQWFWVARGVKDEGIMFIDDHARRNEADAFAISGRDIDRHDVAIAKAMHQMLTSAHTIARADLLRFIEKYHDGIQFSKAKSAKKGLSHSCVRAVIAMAFYSADKERLAEFASSLHSGITENPATDNAVLRLRDWLIATPASGGFLPHRKVVFQKAQAAIDSYLKYKPLAKLYAKDGICFPLPDWNAEQFGAEQLGDE